MKSSVPIFIEDYEKMVLSSTDGFRINVPIIPANIKLDDIILHGTTIASFLIDNGRAAVVVSDGKVSESPLLKAASLEFEKLFEIDRHTVMAVSGSVGFAVLYARMLRNWVETMERVREEPLSTRSKVNMLSRILRENLSIALSGMVVEPILTTWDNKRGPRIFVITPDGSVVIRKTYAISGSGRVNEGGLLLGWNASMSKESGIALAKELVKNASKLDSATGGKIFIKIVSRDGIESIEGGQINE